MVENARMACKGSEKYPGHEEIYPMYRFMGAYKNPPALGQYPKGSKQLMAGGGVIVTAHMPYIQFTRWRGRLRPASFPC